MTFDELKKQIEELKSIMVGISVDSANYRKLIESKNPEYKEIYILVDDELRCLGLENPNIFRDLNDWCGKWKMDLHSYKARGDFINKMYEPLIAQIKKMESGVPEIFEEKTGWEKIEQELQTIKKKLKEAKTSEEYQAIGTICREVFISLAQEVYNPDIHKRGDETISTTDAKRMFELYIRIEFAGETNEILRKYIKSAIDLTNELVHKRPASYQLAGICSESVKSVVNIVALISHKRNKNCLE